MTLFADAALGSYLMKNAAADPHDLQRFLSAQETSYSRALSEIRAGRKRSHWMWFIFPQFDGLGFSSTSRKYAINSLAEAKAYLEHPVLGVRLEEISEAVLAIEDRSAHDIFGSPDDLKLRSSATLFAEVAGEDSTFQRIITKLYDDRPCDKTLRLLQAENDSAEEE